MKFAIYQNKDGVDLLVSIPLKLFDDDCSNCKNFNTGSGSYSQGKCNKYKFICGIGYSCRDYSKVKNNYNINNIKE